jgi:hypothetical protein
MIPYVLKDGSFILIPKTEPIRCIDIQKVFSDLFVEMGQYIDIKV